MIQHNLLPAYYYYKMLCNKLVNMYRSNEAYRFAYYMAINTLSGMINNLQASIITYE